MRLNFKLVSLLLLGTIAYPLFVKAQTSYYDATDFTLLGRAPIVSTHPYYRLPDSLEKKIRPRLWTLSTHSSGMAIRFRSNSKSVSVKWEVLSNYGMKHMTDIGIKGLDLYCLNREGKWRFVNSAQPKGQKNEATIIQNMSEEDREFLLYLPLYDGVSSLKIGVDSLARISKPIHRDIRTHKPLVFYGTSILQGGCASRPGMSFTNILSRALHWECLNFGFSGNAFLDLPIAHFMAGLDASIFVLDFLPNASVEQVNTRFEKFYQILREKHPQTPIVLLEDPMFITAYYDKKMEQEVKSKNAALREAYLKLLQTTNDQHLYLISSEGIIGDDDEATVDGIHFTDLGMMRYAQHLLPYLEKYLGIASKNDSTELRTYKNKRHE